jgi:hypothetical protein
MTLLNTIKLLRAQIAVYLQLSRSAKFVSILQVIYEILNPVW